MNRTRFIQTAKYCFISRNFYVYSGERVFVCVFVYVVYAIQKKNVTVIGQIYSICSHQKCSHTSQSISRSYISARERAHTRPYHSISHLCEQQHRVRVVGRYRLHQVACGHFTNIEPITSGRKRERDNKNTMDKRIKTIEN